MYYRPYKRAHTARNRDFDQWVILPMSEEKEAVHLLYNKEFGSMVNR